MKAEVIGTKQLAAKFKKTDKDVTASMNRGIAEVGEDLLGKSIAVTPLEYGELRQSGYVDHRPGIADVGFSDPKAVYVHELGVTVRPEAAPINWTTPGTHAKFLTGTLNEWRGFYVKHIMDAARKGLR